MVDDQEDWEEEEEGTYLERGEAYQVSDEVELIEKNCPICGRFLFVFAKGTSGTVGVRCRKCKESRLYKLTPARMRIGF